MDFGNKVNGIDTSLNISAQKTKASTQDTNKDLSFDAKKSDNTHKHEGLAHTIQETQSEQMGTKTSTNKNDTNETEIVIDNEISKLFIKAKEGQELSQEEIELLQKENPAIRAIAARVIREEEIFKKALANATSPEDILKLRAKADASHQETIREAQKKHMINEEEGLIINSML